MKSENLQCIWKNMFQRPNSSQKQNKCTKKDINIFPKDGWMLIGNKKPGKII